MSKEASNLRQVNVHAKLYSVIIMLIMHLDWFISQLDIDSDIEVYLFGILFDLF